MGMMEMKGIGNLNGFHQTTVAPIAGLLHGQNLLRVPRSQIARCLRTRAFLSR